MKVGDVELELREGRRGWLSSREPLPVLAARTIDLAGFAMRVEPSRRLIRAPDPDGGCVSRLRRALRFDDLEVSHDDGALAALWLDAAARAALTATLWLGHGGGPGEVVSRVEGATAVLAAGEAQVTPRSRSPVDLERAAAACAALATLPRRIAAAMARELRPLGLSPTGPTWNLSGFALTGVRDGVPVRVDYLRHRGAARTRLRAGAVERHLDGVLRTCAALAPALDALVEPQRASSHPYR
jgi:hypothetical protein